jgi:hypothetical protein
VVTAADFVAYISSQVISVHTTTTTRDSAITSPAEGQFAFTKDTDTLWYYSGSAWVATSLAADITDVLTASNSSLEGGGSSGSISLKVDVDNSTSATATAADYVLIADTDDSNNTKKALISDITALAGDIQGITTAADSGIQGGATSGTPSLSLNLGGLTAAQNIGSDGAGVDVTFHSATAGDYAMWDASDEKLVLEGSNGQTVLDITDGNVVIGDGTLTVGSDGAGEDVTFYSDTAGDSMVWDSSEEKLVITGTTGQNALEIPAGDVSVTESLTVSGGLVAPLGITTNAATAYTFVAGDAGKLVTSDNGSAQTLTVPPNSSVAFAVGTTITIIGIGAGEVTLAEGSGVTINSKDSEKKIDGQHASVTCIKTATDTWQLVGALTS